MDGLRERKKDGDLGRSLRKPPNARQSKKKNNKNKNSQTTSYVTDTQSITETSDLATLLLEAELADRNFEAERNKTVIFELDGKQVTKKEPTLAYTREPLQIPRRPKWNKRTTPAELTSLEKQSFLEWRRQLAKVEESGQHRITPYEKNLEVWRQLWRVVENSDLVMQIVDARNPLLYFSKDLENYVHEVSSYKHTALILNKADLLTTEMKLKWSEYLERLNMPFVFFSAKYSSEENGFENDLVKNDYKYNTMSSQGLVDFMKSFRSSSCVSSHETSHEKPFVVGLVGYPNVGKSSTINSLLKAKRTAVSSTPGKTKHFQTLFLEKDLLLCDCPGLVFPNFTSSKEELICNGILPIDQIRDPIPPMEFVCRRIPGDDFRRLYGITLQHGEENHLNARILLERYATLRGFMTKHGNPDIQRSARIILKDYVNARMVYCEPPPT
ncbi:GTP-binding protein [Galdieria sulphuraria]|uniref:GTP-binding protein n=1 Tax=Galdieria sulphuraria TaxID=130081 RepID=M2WTX1_GALSU|nr:GTP-binding protein [Galdieria sulphuraria]EME27345.1 GTP-binding protein [Galdieria sulphuraria]|eukprot:XP_005703865.1 GTP-binding protein [Galdieria sulphuraria]